MRNPQMEEFVEKVKSHSNIYNIVSNYVHLKRKGKNYWGCCPFHGEKTPSFSVVPDEGFFYCFGCHAGGDVFKFISLIENISWFEAVKLQAEKLDIPLPERERTPQQIAMDQQANDLRKVNDMAARFFHNCLTMTDYGKAGREYWAKRQISPEVIESFQLGFAPDSWDMLTDAFTKREIPKELLLASGLTKENTKRESIYDQFRNRVIIPIMDERGRVVAFGGRVLDDSLPKYLNSPETLIFSKKKTLFGLNRSHRAIQRAGFAIVVEGYMDAIAIFGAGIENVVATLGTAFTPDHCRKLLRYAPAIYFCYDSDEAGQSATIRALSIVQDSGAVVKVITVPDGKDPDEFIRRNGPEAFQQVVDSALPLPEYRMNYVLQHVPHDNLEGRMRALGQLLPMLKGLRHTAERNMYVTRAAQKLLLDEGTIIDELRRLPGGSAVETPLASNAPKRQVVRQQVDARTKAGRIILRHLWRNPEAWTILQQSGLPREEIFSQLQQEVVTFIEKKIEAGEALDAVTAAGELSEEAASELSCALVDGADAYDGVAFADSLKLLRREYLERQYNYHSNLAAELSAAGKDYMQELLEAQRIRNEMDEL